MAWHPPWPRLGIIGCTASPIMTTLPVAHDFNTDGGRSNRSRCSMISSGVSSSTLKISSDQRPSGPLEKRSARYSLLEARDLEPSGSARNAYHCVRPRPTSLVTKYLPGPM